MDFARRFGALKDQAENAMLDSALWDGIPETLCEAMRYSLQAGGKRLRPVLLLAGAALGDAPDTLLGPFAAAIEMIHTYSLIHDDLPAMDNDELRRGRPTNHMVFGEAMAILAGDGLLSLAFETMLRASGNAEARFWERALTAMSLIAQAAGSSGMVAGQSLDLLSEGILDEKTLYEIHKRKTGALISAAVTAGAALGGLCGGKLNCVRRYGDAVGLVFQITDDILDATGTAEQLGKSAGKDESEKKLTFARFYGLEKAQALAKTHTRAAVDAIGALDGDTEFLVALAYTLLDRKN